MARRCFPVAKIGSSNLPGVAFNRAKGFIFGLVAKGAELTIILG